MASGTGQKRAAVRARFSVSRTVERAMPSRRAISCVDTDDAFSRIISRAWRIVIRSAGTDRSLGLPKGRPDQANGGAHQSTKDPGRDHSVMGGAIIAESGGGIIPLRGAASSRNWGAASSGISISVPEPGNAVLRLTIANFGDGALARPATQFESGVFFGGGPSSARRRRRNLLGMPAIGSRRRLLQALMLSPPG